MKHSLAEFGRSMLFRSLFIGEKRSLTTQITVAKEARSVGRNNRSWRMYLGSISTALSGPFPKVLVFPNSGW